MLVIFQLIEEAAGNLQLAGNFPAVVAMLAIFQLIEAPASDLLLACSLPAALEILVIQLYFYILPLIWLYYLAFIDIQK